MLIYKCTNKFTGEMYIGLTTTSLEKRKRRHRRSVYCGSKTKFHEALRKFGFEAFKWRTIEKCNSIDELKEREKYWIEKLNTLEEGYNSTHGGEYSQPKKRRRFKKKKTNSPFAVIDSDEMTADIYTQICISRRLNNDLINIGEEFK